MSNAYPQSQEHQLHLPSRDVARHAAGAALNKLVGYVEGRPAVLDQDVPSGTEFQERVAQHNERVRRLSE